MNDDTRQISWPRAVAVIVPVLVLALIIVFREALDLLSTIANDIGNHAYGTVDRLCRWVWVRRS